MDFFKGLSDRYNEIWKNIISPQRQVYFMNDLGPKVQIVRKVAVIRYDIDIRNSRGQNLKCTFYAPEKYDKSKIGCVIYLHGNAGSRIEALTTFNYLLPRTTLFCFDFAGAGKSEGDYVTLGIKESEDLALMVEYVKKNLGIQKVALWGRSMGAATAINFCANHPKEVCAMALDSGFIKLSIILEEIGKQRTKIPSFLVDTVLLFIKNKINSELKMDIFQLDLIEQIKKIKNIGGIIFGSADKDTIINSYHTQKLFEAFTGEKKHIKFEGDHNTLRSPQFFKTIANFLETKMYGQDMVPLPTLIEEETNGIQIKDISFNSEDQFIQAMQQLPSTLDKTDQLVEQCIKQMEHLAYPFQSPSLPTQASEDRNMTSSTSNPQQYDYYFAQKNTNDNGYSYREKGIQNMNNSVNNTRRIKQICTNVNNESNNNSFQQQSPYMSGITTIANHQKKKSITQRNDLTYSQQMPTQQSQDLSYGIQEVRKSDNTFARKPTILSSNQQGIRTQISTTPDEVMDKKKEDLLKRIFDEIDIYPNSTQQISNDNRINNNFKQQAGSGEPSILLQYPSSQSSSSNPVQNMRYQDASRSPNKRIVNIY